MKQNKKGTELSMNVIIIAAIGLLILVILAMFIFRSGKQVDKGTGCAALGGSCMSVPHCASGSINNVAAALSCDVPGQKCCTPITSGN